MPSALKPIFSDSPSATMPRMIGSRSSRWRLVQETSGSEVISCYEAGLDMTAENAKRFSRLHPRCGTSFLLIVMVLAIFVFAPLGLPEWYWLLASRILGIPLIAESRELDNVFASTCL